MNFLVKRSMFEMPYTNFCKKIDLNGICVNLCKVIKLLGSVPALYYWAGIIKFLAIISFKKN